MILVLKVLFWILLFLILKKITNLDERLITPASSPELYNYESRYPDVPILMLMMNLLQYMNCEASGDPDASRKFLEKHAVKNHFTPDPEFATSPICIKDDDFDFSVDLSLISN